MRFATFAAACLATVAAVAPSIAFAHAKLMSAMPAADSTVAKASALSLAFSDDLIASLSGVDLVMTGMPGMANHKPMAVKGLAVRTKGKMLTVALPRPLPSGTYQLSWHAVGADQHHVEGTYSFTVR